MEHQAYTQEMLDLILQPAFLVKDNRILLVNDPARTLLLSPETEVTSLFLTGKEEYAGFQDGQLYVTLSISGIPHHATILHLPEGNLFLLDHDTTPELFQSMGLLSLQLRQPLTRVMDSAGALFRDMESLSREEAEKFSRMSRSLMQLMRIVNNLSDMERYSLSSCKQIHNICAIVEELTEKAASLTAGTGVSISYGGPAAPIFCQLDSEQLERALWNLLSNSIKFTPSGGTIQVKLVRHGQQLRLTVHDSGSGIAQAVRTSLFRRYLRRPGIEDTRFGIGLGMAIIRIAAANHGGTVLVDQPGETGTRVTMTLSLRQDCDKLCSPILQPDYSGGWDHALVELSDCLPPEAFRNVF